MPKKAPAGEYNLSVAPKKLPREPKAAYDQKSSRGNQVYARLRYCRIDAGQNLNPARAFLAPLSGSCGSNFFRSRFFLAPISSACGSNFFRLCFFGTLFSVPAEAFFSPLLFPLSSNFFSFMLHCSHISHY